jgi:hypothetical protein
MPMDADRLPYFGTPPPRSPTRASDASPVRGRRVVLSTPEGFVYDMRAASNVTQDPDGVRVIDIATEEDYFRWMFLQVQPAVERYPVDRVWIE